MTWRSNYSHRVMWIIPREWMSKVTLYNKDGLLILCIYGLKLYISSTGMSFKFPASADTLYVYIAIGNTYTGTNKLNSILSNKWEAMITRFGDWGFWCCQNCRKIIIIFSWNWKKSKQSQNKCTVSTLKDMVTLCFLQGLLC